MKTYEQAMNEAAAKYFQEVKEVICSNPTYDFKQGFEAATQYWQEQGAGEFDVGMITVSTNDLPKNRLVCKVEDCRELNSQNAATIAALKAEAERLKEDNKAIRDANKWMSDEYRKAEKQLAMCKEALKKCHRKHNQGADDIGWDELGNIIHNTLAEVMGDKDYCAWLEKLNKGERG
jgi:hypothetical protein